MKKVKAIIERAGDGNYSVYMDADEISYLITGTGKTAKEAIESFMIVFDALGSNTVSTEWLTKLEREHAIFPWMNFRMFSRKK